MLDVAYLHGLQHVVLAKFIIPTFNKWMITMETIFKQVLTTYTFLGYERR